MVLRCVCCMDDQALWFSDVSDVWRVRPYGFPMCLLYGGSGLMVFRCVCCMEDQALWFSDVPVVWRVRPYGFPMCLLYGGSGLMVFRCVSCMEGQALWFFDPQSEEEHLMTKELFICGYSSTVLQCTLNAVWRNSWLQSHVE